MKAHVLLTGVTGFVGKVVLEQLIRRREELSVSRVTVMVRPKQNRSGHGQTATQRFARVASAACFAHLPAGWTSLVDVVSSDLEQPDAGLSEAARDELSAKVTHVIHCAASVEFDLPVSEAAAANIRTALTVLELARRCKRLVRMIDVSTAYVSTWRPGRIGEQLAHLPKPAADLYRAFQVTQGDGREWLALTGHPNTYTLTKCVAEHLLTQRRGTVPLVIVRPSIISAAWKEPFAGWIDSSAALAGCLLAAGLGLTRAFKVDPGVRLDVIPVDVVARDILNAAFGEVPALESGVAILHSTAGVQAGLRIDTAASGAVEFFKGRPGVHRRPGLFLGTGADFERVDFLRREVPFQVLRAGLWATRNHAGLKRLERFNTSIRGLNDGFAYFTRHTFDFYRSRPLGLPDFEPTAYLDVVYRGMYQHLMRRDDTQLSFAGPKHDDARSDLQWLRERPRVAPTMSALGLGLRKALRQCTNDITFDRPSVERAVAEVPSDALVMLAPTHRSYLDFLLASYFCFEHPELGVPVPHIAAAQEFSALPVVGRILRNSQAFFLKRGVGHEAVELREELKRLTAQDASLMAFIEGQRSRGRSFLPPKRGFLRGLQATGRKFAVIPVAISYDRVPEEIALLRELGGAPKPKMSVRALLEWLTELYRGRVALGRVHIAFGRTQLLEPHTDVKELSYAVMGELQRHTTVSSFHLRAFLAEGSLTRELGIDEKWLKGAIEARGGRVLESDLLVPALTPALEQSLRNQWRHWFYGDALERHPDNLAVREHVRRNGWMAPVATSSADDARVGALVDALFVPISRAYVSAADHLAETAASLRAADVTRADGNVIVAHVQEALEALAAHQLAVMRADGYVRESQPNALAEFSAKCMLPPAVAEHMARSLSA